MVDLKKTAPTAIGADIQVKPTGDGKSLLLFNQNKSNLCILLHAADIHMAHVEFLVGD